MRARTFILASAASVMLYGHAVAQEDLKIAVPNWAAAQVMSDVVGKVLTNELGLQIGKVPSTNPVIFEAMDRGAGDIDVHPDVWLPNQQNLVDKYVKERGTVKLATKSYWGQAGICATKATIDSLGISSIYDLTDPDIARKFDTDGDGKGEIWIGPSGTASVAIDRVRLNSYGVGETFELMEMDEEPAMARIRAANSSGDPLVTMCVRPHSMWKIADLIRLEEPAYDESKWTMVQPTDDPNWLQKSDIEVSWPQMKVQLAYATRLEEAYPKAAEILSRVYFDTEMIDDFNFEVIEAKRDPGEVADEWIANNQDRVREWLNY